LTVFAILPDCDRTIQWQEDIETANSKIHWRAELNTSDMRAIRQKELFAPSSNDELVMMLSTFTAVAGLMFGRRSYLHHQLVRSLDHMYAMMPYYKAPGPASNRYWYTKILYKIDITVQTFLKECGKARRFSNVRFEELCTRLKAIRTGVEGGDISVGLLPQFVDKNQPN
jgi:hypothetical protein